MHSNQMRIISKTIYHLHITYSIIALFLFPADFLSSSLYSPLALFCLVIAIKWLSRASIISLIGYILAVGTIVSRNDWLGACKLNNN